MVDDGNIVMKVTKVDKDGITVVAVNRYPTWRLPLELHYRLRGGRMTRAGFPILL